MPNKWPADRVERRPIEALIPYARNSRTHSDAQVAQIAASMQEWGWTNPVLVDETGMIIAGHGRVLAARKLGLAEVPVMVAEGWTEPQKRAYVLADNQLALNAGWDMDLLSNELADLQAAGFDLELTGFSDIDALLAGRGTAGLTDPDAVPEPGARAVATLGDVWLLGGHRLVCGDSTDAAAVVALMGGVGADAVFTDPPYNVAYSGRGQNNLGTIKNDDMDAASFNEFLDAVFDCCLAAMKPLACIYVCHPDSQSAPKLAFERSFSERFKKSSTIIWVKQSAGMGWQDYRAQHEPILYGWKEGGGKHYFCGNRAETTVWQIGRDPQAGYVHPTQKPVDLPRRAIENSTKPEQIVLDLFGGSGSTMMACEISGRFCRSMELDPIYVDVAIKRWQDFTGGKATLESTGQTFEDVADARYDWRKDGFESWEVWCAAKREELVKAGKAA